MVLYYEFNYRLLLLTELHTKRTNGPAAPGYSSRGFFREGSVPLCLLGEWD